MLESFTESVSRIPGVGVTDLHDAQRSAKLLRRRIESGHRPTEADWREHFPDPSVMRLAQIHLDEGPGEPSLDPEATLRPGLDPEPLLGRSARPSDDEAAGVERQAWYELLSDLPEEGLPRGEGSDARVDHWTLGRWILEVSRGMGTVELADLPVAGGFRERFLELASRTGRLECIRSRPQGT